LGAEAGWTLYAGGMATFEDRLTALETVVERLERGELSLDDSVRLFEEGVQLSSACKAELEKAEGRVQVLVEGRGGAMQVAEMELEEEEEGNVDGE
jgi:exodeoxyribonuclease VII small subunit